MTANNTVAGFQLSAQQARLWSQQTEQAEALRSECEILIEGALDKAKLETAVRQLIERHEILRTVFQRQPGLKVPFQVILDEAEFGRDAAPAFDIEQGPVMHAAVMSETPQRHTLRISLPALSADLRSLQNIVAELLQLYSGQRLDTEVMQYADVTAWQEELLAGDDTKAGREFWRDNCRKLDFADAPLSAFKNATCAAFAPGTVRRTINDPTAAPDFLLACWQAFLARMTGRSSIVVGKEFDGRKYAELENAVGLFAKYLPLELDYDATMPVEILAKRVESAAEAAHDWQEAFAWQQLDVAPVLPLAFEFAELPAPQQSNGTTFTVRRLNADCEQFHLKLAVRRIAQQTSLEFQFDSSVLDRATVNYWANCFVAFLSAAIANPTTPVGRLPLLDAGERQRLVSDWNSTQAPYPDDRCLHELFEVQAALHPDRPAVRSGETSLTYRELNQRANQLASALRGLGVGPDSLVGLCVDRSVDMIVALLGILKTGGAFVPVSADHPKTRLMQQLAGATLLVTEEKFAGHMSEFAARSICVDREADWWNQLGTNLVPQTMPENLAYLIYTSGSTGTPKGVAVRHRNLVNYASFICRRLQVERYPDGLHFATVSTLNADLGNTCIYPSLISGGCLHVIPQDVASDSARLRASMSQWPIDVLKIVPSHLAALLDSDGGREVLPRRYLITGGEALTPRLLEKILAAGPACQILNHYGPTETTVGSLTLALKDYDWKASTAKTIPIGRPIANTRVYVLDPQLEPVTVGVAGELFIAGDGVTAGYLNQPELTAERFLADPFGNGKMYRTGDLVRYLPDGNIEFLGRVDDQVKIRGFRIELGEVESVLARHESVKQAIALAREDERGDKRLVAYVVANPGRPIDLDRLREHARAELPDYMVPSAFVVIPKVPLNANGKIDRQALPAPEESASARKEHIAPRTPIEEMIAAIWSDVLRRPDISVEDDFFEIGGHSLLATQIASRLRAQFRIAAPVRMIFEAPTIAGLARRMDQARREEQGLVPPSITPVPRDSALPLSFAQERLWVLDSLEPNNPLYNIARALRIKGNLNISALENALNEIVRRHESQRTTFGISDGHPVQIIVPSLTIPIVVRDLTGTDTEQEARRIAAAESLEPFNLRTGPLVRASLLKLADEDQVLLLTMHHIISDAWSAGILFQELGILYEAFSQGRPSPLPELPAQYADYAAHERSWLSGDVLDKKLAYWRDQLHGAPPVLDLPTDRPRPKTRTFAGSYEGVAIPKVTVTALKELGRQEGTTLFMTMLAAFQVLLSRYSGQQEVVIGTDVANRDATETERMIGFFVNLLPVRTDLSGNPTFRELLRQVRDRLLEGYANQEVPFAKIVQELQPERSSSHNPIVQVLFVMQNIPRPKRALAGLGLEVFEVPLATSKFDIGVFLNEKADDLLGYWVYSTELFDSQTILKMAGHFATLLAEAVRQPDERLSALEMLSQEEKQRQEEDRKRRKQGHMKMLRAVAPESVGISPKVEDKR
jgi:amino acid adenylation domain-containing protein